MADYLESPMYWLKRAYLVTRRAMDEALASHHLTGSQFEVLRQVLTADGIEQRMLQERLKISSATLTGLVDGLVARGLVRREVLAGDARVKQLFASAEARALDAAIHTAVRELEAQLLAGFTPAERLMVRELLQRMATNLGPAPDEHC